MFPTLPLEIWEMVFDLLPGRELQTISKVPRLHATLAVARRSAHRLEVYRAGLVDLSRPGSRTLSERVELLKAYRARWENLRWAEVTRLPPRPLWIYHFAGNVLAYTSENRASVMGYLDLPFGGAPVNSREDDGLGLEHGIKTFAADPERNSLVILEEWHDGNWLVPTIYARLHIRRLDSTRDIVVPHNGQLKVCQPFRTDIAVDEDSEDLSCEIEQTGHYLAILVTFYAGGGGYCSEFIMWDVITQEQVVNLISSDYRSFTFLDHRWVLFGAVRNDPYKDADRRDHPYLEIIDPTDPARSTTLQLDTGVVKHRSYYSSVDISVGGGVGREEAFLIGSGGMPFAPDTSRGIITADVYLYHRDPEDEHQDGPQFESYVFILDSEDMLAKTPSPSNPGQCYVEWKDLSLSAATFSYSAVNDRYRIFSRHSYVIGFCYASPIQPLAPEDPEGPRCFFVYDFNPYRETSDLLPSGGPDPKTNYLRNASEITREVIGGLSCWRMRFDLPAAKESVRRCHVALTDGGVVLFELSDIGEESITVFSIL